MRSKPRMLRAALKGADAVIETLGAKASLAMVTSHTRLFSDATRILIQCNGKRGRETSDLRDGLWRRRQPRTYVLLAARALRTPVGPRLCR